MKALRLVLANGVCLLGAVAAVGAESFSYEKAGVTYQIVRFTDTAAAQSWTVPEGVTAVDVLAVGGGGAGGAAKYNKAYCGAGGGGAGAFIYNEGLAVAPGQVFTVKVGKGGIASTTAVPGDGEASEVVNETANISLTAAGGGHGGGCVSGAGAAGGCGGGGYDDKVYGGLPNGLGTGTSGGSGAKIKKSNDTVRGVVGGGGGGAGFAGYTARSYNGCSGGDGLFCRITGESVCYGGGGGGGAAQADNGNTGNGGLGGGGKGGDEGAGTAGTDGLGGGGGGGSSTSKTTVYKGGNGGSGVVIIRYAVDMGTAVVPSNLSPNGTQVNIHNAKQKEFLAMSESELRSKFTDSSWRGTISKQGDCLPLPVTFSWTGGGYNTVKVYNADGSLFLEKAVRGNSTELWGFDIGTNYTWEVVNSVMGASARAAFTTELEVPRMFRDPNFDEVAFDGSSTCTRKLNGVINMRELGGYVGLEGKRIRTGRLIRTARITENSLYSRDPGRSIGDSFVKTDAARAFWLNTIKVKTQVDLRNPSEYGSNYIGNEVGVFGPSVRWVKFTTANDEQTVPCYDGIFTEQGKANYKLLLDEMLNPTNHPIVFHCSAGKDRTGTVAYILEAILGVSDEDKFRDWIALVLSSTDTQFSPTGAYDPLVAGFSAYDGETQNDRVVSFVKSLGITDSQVEVFRTAMLEGYGEPVVPPEEHPYTVTWTGAAGDGLWATAGNWDKELTNVDSVLFTNDATVTIATATPGAALTVGSGKTMTIKGTAGVTAEFVGATAEYQALVDGATLIADGGTGFRLTSDKGFRFGSDTTYRVLNGCYSKLSGLRIGDSKNVRFETDASHLKFDINGVLSADGEIVCRTANVNGLLELGTAKLTAGTLRVVSENGATNTVGDLQDNGAVVALSVGTNAVFRVTGGEDHLFYLGATAGSSLDFHGPSPKVQLSYCNAVNLGANLTVRLTPEASWSDWSLIQKPSAPGICTISSAIHYEIDTRALAGVTNAFSFYLYNSLKTTDKHNIAVPAAGNVTLVGPCADDFEATFSKPDNYKLQITLAPKKVTQPTVDGEPVDPAEVFTLAKSTKPIVYPSAPELTGEVGAQTIAFGGVSVNVPRYYTATLSDNTVTLALNDFARPVLEDSDDDKKAIAVGETTVSLHVGKRIAGLFYRVVTTTALGGDWVPVTAFLPVGDFTVDRKATDTSAFYKIEVSDIGESAP